MKKHILLLTFILTLILSTVSVFGTTELAAGVMINGTPVNFTKDTGYPFIDSNGRTQVPLRITLESFGCIVGWDQKNQTATLTKNETTVQVPVGMNFIYKDGTQITNDTQAVNIDGRIYLPIRVVLESFGAKVDWDGKNVLVGSGAGENGVDSNETTDKVSHESINTKDYEEFKSMFEIVTPGVEFEDGKTGVVFFVTKLDKETLQQQLKNTDIEYIMKQVIEEYCPSGSTQYEIFISKDKAKYDNRIFRAFCLRNSTASEFNISIDWE